MNILPAIDLYEGRAVRLFKGDYAQMTVYDPQPLIRRAREYCAAQSFAEKFDDAGLQAVARHGSRALLAFAFQRLASGQPLPPELVRRLGEHPVETAGAMFMASIN